MEYAITTVDNPFNPFDQFVEWYLFDKDMGYDSCEFLARVADVDDTLSDAEKNREVERAIDRIIRFDFLHIYKKVERKASA